MFVQTDLSPSHKSGVGGVVGRVGVLRFVHVHVHTSSTFNIRCNYLKTMRQEYVEGEWGGVDWGGV